MDLGGAMDSHVPHCQACGAQVKGERRGAPIPPLLMSDTLEQLGKPRRVVTVQTISGLNHSDPIAHTVSWPSKHEHTRRDRPTDPLILLDFAGRVSRCRESKGWPSIILKSIKFISDVELH